MVEVVILLGFPSELKSNIASEYISKGYYYIHYFTEIDFRIKQGYNKFILNDYFLDIQSRASVIYYCKFRNIHINCVWLDTSFEEDQFNICIYMVKKYGRLLTLDEIKENKDKNVLSPFDLLNYRNNFENPKKEEGFNDIHVLKNTRKFESDYKNSALILDYDDNIRCTRNGSKYNFPISAEEVVLLPNRKERIFQYIKQFNPNYILGWSNQSCIAKNYCTEENVINAFNETNRLLGLDIDFFYCPHNSFLDICYCRKPNCGFGAFFIEKYKLLPEKCLFVGDQKTDEIAAKRCGFNFLYTSEFFLEK